MAHLFRAADWLPWRWMCIHAGCIIWIGFAPPLFTFALQSVMLSRPVCSQLHYPTAFGIFCTCLSSAFRTWTLRPCPCKKMVWSFSYQLCLVLFSASWEDYYLLWQQRFARHMIPAILNTHSYLKYLFPFQVIWGNRKVIFCRENWEVTWTLILQ